MSDTKGRKKGKGVGRAPREIVPLPNPDKTRHEKYKNGQNPIRFPKPFRCCILGKVNSGKSLLAKHILMAHQGCSPKFEQVFVVHGCESTDEYKSIQPTEMMHEIPNYKEFDPKPLKLLLIDDYDFSMISPKELKNLSEMFRFGTHINLSIILMHQSWFRIPKIVKDCSNVFIIFRPHDDDELSTIGRRVGMKKDEIFGMFKELLPNWRDSLLINLIPNAPYKYGKNLFEPIEENQSDESDESDESESD